MQPGAHTALYRKIPISASAKTAGRSKTKIPPPAGPALACRFLTGRHSAGAACGQPAGRPCVTASGNEANDAHAARRQLLAETGPPAEPLLTGPPL